MISILKERNKIQIFGSETVCIKKGEICINLFLIAKYTLLVIP